MSAPQLLKHMMPNDIPLWASYYFSPEGQSFHCWQFDTLTGDPHDPGAYFPPAQRKQALYVNSLKIDAVAWFFDTPTIIECKPKAGLGAIGQVQGYQTWWQIHNAYLPRGIIVCKEMSRQVQTYATLKGVDVRIVPKADPSVVQMAMNDVRNKVKVRSVPRYYESVSY